MEAPKTLQEAIQYFTDFENCRKFMASIRWLDGVVRCPICNSGQVDLSRKMLASTSATASTRVRSSRSRSEPSSRILRSLWRNGFPRCGSWFNCKNGISSYEIHRALGVTQKIGMVHAASHSACHAKQVIRESWAKRWHRRSGRDLHRRQARKHAQRNKARCDTRRNSGQNHRDGNARPRSRQVRAKVIPNVKRETLQNEILNEVKHGSTVYTDEYVGYDYLRSEFVHEIVNHAEQYVERPGAH